MTAEPYTPDEADLRDSYAGVMDEYVGQDYDQAKADAERGIAKIKADAIRDAADEFSKQKGLSFGDALTIRWFNDLADRIEGEA